MKNKAGIVGILVGLAIGLSMLSPFLAVQVRTELVAVRQGAGEEAALRVSLSEAEAEIAVMKEKQTALERELVDARSSAAYPGSSVRSIAHRGVSAEAPENTLPAFRLAVERGFTDVETDIFFTSDGVPVCIHDGTIDRTSNGSGEVWNMTLEELRQYDFGSWMGEKFAGTQIPTFEEYLLVCKNLGLRPVIEMKTGGPDQIRLLVETVNRCGMRGKVSWISFQPDLLSYVRWNDDEARLGFLVGEINVQALDTLRGLRSSKNEVFLSSCVYNDWVVEECARAGFPLEVWTLDTEEQFAALDPYVTGVTSNCLSYGQYLYKTEMNNR